MSRITFFLILILGILLRIAALNGHDFWFDEALTYHFAKLDLASLLTVVAADNNPPLYYILIHFLLKISSNEIFLRLPSLVASILTVAVLWRLSPIAASLFSVSPLAIYIGTEARLHSLATFLGILSYYFFLNVLKKSNLKNIALFIITLTFGIYTQYYLALLLIPLLIITFFKKGRLLWIFSIPLTLLLPWLIFSFSFPHNGCWCPNSLISLPATLTSPAIGGVGIVTQRAYPLLPLPTLLLFLITGLLSLALFLKGVFKNLSLSLIYFVPIFILSLTGTFWPVFSPKGASVFSPFFFLISAQYLLSNKSRSFITLMILLGAVSLFQITSPFFKGDNLKAISEIISSQKHASILHLSLATYYTEKFYLPESNHFLLSANPLNSKMIREIGGQQTETLPQTENIWLIDSPLWTNEKSYQEIKSLVFAKYRTLLSYKVNGANVHYLKIK